MSLPATPPPPPPLPSGVDYDAVIRDLDCRIEHAVQRLLEYRPEADSELVWRAYRFAREKHKGQIRKSGEPYIVHPVEVCRILVELEMAEPVLAASLLHDVVEDCGVELSELHAEFGPEIERLVDGLTKLQIMGVDEGKEADEPDSAEEVSPAVLARRKKQADTAKNAANLRKIFVAMAKDLRIIIIKLADRLHNMRTLSSLSPSRQLRMANETLQIFAPLAHRLGIWQLKWQLEDLAFKYAQPEAYAVVAQLVARNRGERQAEVDEAMDALKAMLAARGIEADVKGRPKHLYSIHNKMQQHQLEFNDLFDLTALRVIVHTRDECYRVLAEVGALWAPIPGMFSDYIAQSKGNLYQSLHTKVIGPSGRPLEVQIRTWEMHRTAEFGVAAHWQYKEGGRANNEFERRISFLQQQLFDWHVDSKDHNEFMRNVSEDLFADQVFVRTPGGDVIDLPAGSTPVDFAYRVHSKLGEHTVGARVNGRMVPLTYSFDPANKVFKNGDVVEIITRPSAQPSRDWLAHVKTSHARSRIRSYFRRVNQAENVQRGREAMERELTHQVERDPKGWGENPTAFLKDEAIRGTAAHFNVGSEVELLAAIGYGTIAPITVLTRLKPPPPPPKDAISTSAGVADDRKLQIRAGSLDAKNLMFRRSLCCLPIPGDDAIGYITRGSGMALHRRTCKNAATFLRDELERCRPVEYVGNEGQVYKVVLRMETIDRTGLLADVSAVFGENKTNITAVKTNSHRNHTVTMEISIEVRNTDHLTMILDKVRGMPDVLEADRT